MSITELEGFLLKPASRFDYGEARHAVAEQELQRKYQMRAIKEAHDERIAELTRLIDSNSASEAQNQDDDSDDGGPALVPIF